jgi:translation initiation factor IF-3
LLDFDRFEYTESDHEEEKEKKSERNKAAENKIAIVIETHFTMPVSEILK